MRRALPILLLFSFVARSEESASTATANDFKGIGTFGGSVIDCLAASNGVQGITCSLAIGNNSTGHPDEVFPTDIGADDLFHNRCFECNQP